MTDFTVIEARPWHCGQMTRILRIEQTAAMAGAGIDVHRELRTMFDNSMFRRAWLIDGRLAAMGGVAGSPLESTAYLWMAMSREAQRHPVALVKMLRGQLREARATHPMLVTTLLPEDEASIRFAVFMGFHIRRSGPGASVVSRPSRRDLMSLIASDPDIRVPLGKSYAMTVVHTGEVF